MVCRLEAGVDGDETDSKDAQIRMSTTGFKVTRRLLDETGSCQVEVDVEMRAIARVIS